MRVPASRDDKPRIDDRRLTTLARVGQTRSCFSSGALSSKARLKAGSNPPGKTIIDLDATLLLLLLVQSKQAQEKNDKRLRRK